MEKKIGMQHKMYIICVCAIMSTTTIFCGLSVAFDKTMNSSADRFAAVVQIKNSNTLNTLVHQGITLLTVDQSKTSAVVLATPKDFTWLAAMNLQPQRVPDDFAEHQGWMYNADLERDFHNYAQMTTALETIADTYPDIATLYDIGTSVQGRTIWGLKITKNPTIEEDEPEVRICGVHHGNEYMGAELSLLLAQYLTDNYGSNDTVTSLVDTREIWIIPMVNPDGREMGSRENAHGVDLNRDYGYMWGGWSGSTSPFSQPETQAMRENALENNFVLSLSYHTSAEVVNYVWNYKHQRVPDNTVVEYLSNQYASHNGYWVVEGYDWYQTMGDTNDFSYGCRGDIDWTIETPNSDIPLMWQLHGEAMFDIIKAADMGLRGIVTDAQTGQPLAAIVWVEEAYWPCFTDPLVGDFHKPLMPGTYHVIVRANGYQQQEFSVDVQAGQPTVFNVALSRASNYYAYQITVADYFAPSDNFQNNPTEAIAALGPPDGSCASIGVNGYIICDMYDNITDGIGTDLKIYEGDGTDDGYTVYGSMNWNGPWTSIGTGMGTTEFDLSDASLTSVRYVKIVDDGTGNPSEMKPGCDIDAVENLAAANANQPPNNPVQPTGPTAGATNVAYSYTTATIDPESQQVYYQWSWGDSVSPWLGPYESGVSMNATHSWNSSGDYEVKVKAKDLFDLESGWSDPLMVNITTSPQIEIGEISGGLGITTEVNNVGEEVATDVRWNISLDSGLILLGRTTSGTLSEIQPGSSAQIRSKFILGIGTPTITVSAATVKKTVSAFVLGPFVFIRK